MIQIRNNTEAQVTLAAVLPETAYTKDGVKAPYMAHARQMAAPGQGYTVEVMIGSSLDTGRVDKAGRPLPQPSVAVTPEVWALLRENPGNKSLFDDQTLSASQGGGKGLFS